MAEASSTEEGITLRIRFKSETLEKFVGKYASDIGPTEIFVRTREPLPSGTWLNFDFSLQDGGPLLAGRGVVAWTRDANPTTSEPAGMSIRYDKLTPAGKQQLSRLLDVKAKLAGGGAAAGAGKAGGRTPSPAASDPERHRKTTPYRTVVPDDPAAALAAAGSLSGFGRGKSAAGATTKLGAGAGPTDGPISTVSAKTSPGRSITPPGSAATRDLGAATPEDGERTEVARMPPSFYYDAADDEATRVRIDERDAESITPLDDLDDITSPRAEIPVAATPAPRPDLSVPWRPPTPPPAGSLAASLRPPNAGLGPQGRGDSDSRGGWSEPRHTASYGGEAGSLGTAPAPVGSASLRPTRTRVNTIEGYREPTDGREGFASREHALGRGIGPDQPTPRPEPEPPELEAELEPDDAESEVTTAYDSAPVAYQAGGMTEEMASPPMWDSVIEASGKRRGGTMKVWLATAAAASAVILGALWAVPKFVMPPVASIETPPAAAPADPTTPALAVPPAGQPGQSGGPIAAPTTPPGAPGAPGAPGSTSPAAPTAAAAPAPATPPAAGKGAIAGRPVVEPLAAAGSESAAAIAQAARPARKVRNIRPRRSLASGVPAEPPVPTPEISPSPPLSPGAPASPTGTSSAAAPGAAPTPPSVALSTPPPAPSPPPPGQLAPSPSPTAQPQAIVGGPVPASAEEEVYWLNVKSVPPGADVLIDGQVEGKTPFQRRIFDPGRTYALTIRKPGFESVERSLSAADQWLRRGNVRTLTINARLMATTLSEPPIASDPGVSARPAAPEPPSLPPVPPAVPPKANPFDEPPPAGRTP